MEASQTQSRGQALQQAMFRAARPGERMYGVVDSARDRALARAAWFDFNLENWSLFDSRTAPQMARVAPYLIPLEVQGRWPYPGSGYLDLWAEKLGRSAGILLLSDALPRTLWEHLTHIFNVADEDGQTFFFRFYDPRVLRAFLPTCSPSQLTDFFGPIRAMIVESDGGEELQVYSVGAGGLEVRGLAVE